MPAPYKADAIANEFLDGRLNKISPMKLQKLVYYAHAWSLGLFGEELVEEPIEAWPYGPVIPTLYHEFKGFGNRPVARMAIEIDDQLNKIHPRIDADDVRTAALIKRIWKLLGNRSAVALSNMTHAPNEPWAKIPVRSGGIRIPNKLIKKCFKKILSHDE